VRGITLTPARSYRSENSRQTCLDNTWLTQAILRWFGFLGHRPERRTARESWSSTSDTFSGPLLIWDKFNYPGHRQNTPYIQIGRKDRKPRHIKFEKHPNPFKQALHYQDLLESGQADSQGKLAHLIGTPRTTISAYLRLLRLDEEVLAEALGIPDQDERVSILTEPRLRHLVALQRPKEQRAAFRALLAIEGKSTHTGG